MASSRRTRSWRAPHAGVVMHGSAATARAEAAELAAMASFYGSAAPALRESLGLRLERVGGALVLIMASADVFALNRVIGLGVNAPCRERDLDHITARFAEMGVARWFAQVVPGAEPPRLHEWLEDRGFTPYNRWVRLVRSAHRVAAEPVPEGIVLRRAERADADLFGELVTASFGWPAPVGALVAATVGRPGWRHTLAWSGENAVGTGALYTAGDVAWLGFGTVSARARRRGVHRALALHRLLESERLGCTEISVETAEPTEEHPAPSYRNMLALGFQERYRRQNWVKS